MAIILLGKTKCSVCELVLNKEDKIVATTHFITDSNDSLWRYSDSAMHKNCFINWQYKQEFINKYNNSIGKIIWGNGTSHRMEDDGQISTVKIEN